MHLTPLTGTVTFLSPFINGFLMMHLTPLTGTVTFLFSFEPTICSDASYSPHGDSNLCRVFDEFRTCNMMHLTPLTGTVTFVFINRLVILVQDASYSPHGDSNISFHKVKNAWIVVRPIPIPKRNRFSCTNSRIVPDSSKILIFSRPANVSCRSFFESPRLLSLSRERDSPARPSI